MKFKLVAVLALVFVHAVIADDTASAKPGSLTYLDAQYGFRDLKFEQAFADCKDMVLVEDAGDMKFYQRKNDVMEQGGVKLKILEYGFYKGKLACVSLNVADDADPAPLLQNLEVNFGTAKRSPSKPGKVYWFGQKVLMDYWSGGVGRCTVGLWSKPLQALRMADQKAKTK